LRLALDVDAGALGTAGVAEHASERALADGDRNALAGACDHFDQQAQVRADAAGTLFLDQEAGEGRAVQSQRLAVVVVRHGAFASLGTRHCRRNGGVFPGIYAVCRAWGTAARPAQAAGRSRALAWRRNTAARVAGAWCGIGRGASGSAAFMTRSAASITSVATASSSAPRMLRRLRRCAP